MSKLFRGYFEMTLGVLPSKEEAILNAVLR